jgi:hypothetical protein
VESLYTFVAILSCRPPLLSHMTPFVLSARWTLRFDFITTEITSSLLRAIGSRQARLLSAQTTGLRPHLRLSIPGNSIHYYDAFQPSLTGVESSTGLDSNRDCGDTCPCEGVVEPSW